MNVCEVISYVDIHFNSGGKKKNGWAALKDEDGFGMILRKVSVFFLCCV